MDKNKYISPNGTLQEHVKSIGKQAKNMKQPLSADEIFLKYSQYRVTAEKDIPTPVSIVKIDGEIVCTQSTISTISGGVKTGKSAVTSVLLAGALSTDGDIIDAFSRLEIAPNIDGKAVIHIDTEQSEYKHQKNIKTVIRRANYTTTPEYFLSYNSVGLQIDEAKEMLVDICIGAHEKYKGIHLMVIDGIADFIYDVNDPSQAAEIVTYMRDLAKKYHTTIIVIIHTNPNSEKERGHLGSECLRKSESILTVTQDGDISSLSSKHMREAGRLQPIKFIYSKEKHYHIEYLESDATNVTKDALRLSNIKDIARAALPPPTACEYGDAIENIMRVSNKAIATAKTYFKEMSAHRFIIQGDDKNWRFNIAA